MSLLFLFLQLGNLASAAKPAWIDAFGGWAGPTGGMLYARVHSGLPLAKPKPAESSFARLEQTVQALELNALEAATVRISGLPGIATATANDHGFIALKLPAGLPVGTLRVELQVSVTGYESAATPLLIDVWADRPELGIISDIDDTMTDTGVTHKAKMLLGTFFHSEYEVQLFGGAAATIGALCGSDVNHPQRPLLFLSGSPWGLHERIADAFDRNGVPHRVTVLRSLSKEKLDAYQFKLPHLQQIFAALPKRKWLLFGDTGEKDPEVYAQLRSTSPSQVEHIYIHNVTAADAKSPRYSGMTLFQEWSDIRSDLASHGYLLPVAAPPSPLPAP